MPSNNQSNNTGGDVKPVVRLAYSTRLKSATDSNVPLQDNSELGGKEESNQMPGAKRKADLNLAKQEYGVKRFALGNLTNAETGGALVQKPNKVSVPIAKPKMSDDPILKASKIRGPTKILTRAAMRLELALGNKRKAEKHTKKQFTAADNVKENGQLFAQPATASSDGSKVDTRTSIDFEQNDHALLTTALSNGSGEPEAVNAIPSSSRLTKDFARIRVDVGAVPTDETTSPEAGDKNAKLCTQKYAVAAVKSFLHVTKKHAVERPVPSVSNNDKKLQLSTALETKHKGRLSNDFEMSDDSLYVNACDIIEEGASSSTGHKPFMFKAAEQFTKKNVPLVVKSSQPEPSKIEQKPILPAKPTVPSVPTNEPKKTLESMMEAKLKKRMSSEFELSDDSLYMSAIDILDEQASSSSGRLSENATGIGVVLAPPPIVAPQEEKKELDTKCIVSYPAINSSSENDDAAKPAVDEPGSPRKRIPPGVEDFDKCYWYDIYQVSEYAQSIFDYLRDREPAYVLPDYIDRQPHVTKWMRALLVDWMVEIQESFELNHETLYLAVKIVDTYLSLVEIQREALQLVAAAALLIAAKYDERVPPTVDDFIYICDGAYERPELLKMERTVFRAIGFDLGYPLSYRFLRRFARVIRCPMPTLTLARYILETSLMEYATVLVSDSKLACAALFIALRMSGQSGWNITLEFYSGYKVDDFKDAVVLLNNGILLRKSTLNTVRQKYSHELFFHVAKRPVIASVAKLFDTSDVLFKMPTAVGATVATRKEQTPAADTDGESKMNE